MPKLSTPITSPPTHLITHASLLQFTHHRLPILSKAVWVIVVILTLGLFLAAVPIRYNQYTQMCDAPNCFALQLTSNEASALHKLGFSLNHYALYLSTLGLVSSLIYILIACLIFWRKSREGIALLVSLWLVTFGTADTLVALANAYPVWRLPIGILDQLGWTVLLPLFLLAFPTGQFVPRWTRWFFLSWIIFLIVDTILHLPPTDLADPSPWPTQFAWFTMQFTGIASQIYRYRRVSTVHQRQQTRWIVFGLVAIALAILLTVLIRQIPLSPDHPDQNSLFYKFIEMSFVPFAFSMIPLTIGISILRYHLWDIDILIRRTIIYTVLSMTLIVIYASIVGILSAIFHTSGNILISLVATGTIAVVFQPLRFRFQRAINHYLFGERDDPVGLLSRLSHRLDTSLTSETMFSGTVEMIAHALKLPYVAIQLSADDNFNTVAEIGQSEHNTRNFPLIHQSATLGRLVVAPRSPVDAFIPADLQLLENIARHAALAIHLFNLTADLQRSRERLIAAREEERRRIRRDLHDGLGPALATLSLQAETARDLIHTDSLRSENLLSDVVTGTQSAIADIRRVVYGLRPPVLDDLGLLSAILEQTTAYATNDLHIRLDAPQNLPMLPAAVEVAIFRIAQEALTNVVRHAKAHTCILRLALFNTHIHLDICDDGIGFSQNRRAGVGLNSIHERAAELGGHCRIDSSPQIGTRIHVSLPMTLGDYHEPH